MGLRKLFYRGVGVVVPGARLVLSVHDELVFEVPPAELERIQAVVRFHMENVVELRVPLVVDLGIGPNWLEAKR